MNEEQKQAIKELKHFTNMTVFWKEKEYTSHEIDNCINIVLHLIEKQQKEIEEQQKVIDEMAKQLVDLPIPISQEEDIMILNYVKRFFYKKIEKK